MKPLRVKPPPALNQPAQWHRYLRPWFDQQAYQARIDARVSTNRDGKSIIRLVWTQDVTTTAYGATTPRYWTRRRKDGEGYQYWKVPRWVFEKRLEPEQFVPAWEASRWAMRDESGTPVDKGDPPAEWYTFAYLCAEHEAVDPSTGWAHCCTRAYYTDRSRCWGRYRNPSTDDLDLISQAVRQMEAEKWVDPYAPMTAQQLEEAEYNANLQVERFDQQMADMEADMAKQFYRLHGHHLFGESSPIFDIGAHNRTESGLIVPD